MGYYCTVPQCTSLAGKTKNVKFHRFPRDADMAEKWNNILKRGKPFTIYSKVCSLHFTQADYNVTTMGQWKTLSKDAIPTQNLPKLNPDGTVMVIRKSRIVKEKEIKKEVPSDIVEKWSPLSTRPEPANVIAALSDPHANYLYRLQEMNVMAKALSSQESLPLQITPRKPKKQDAFMQTDPVKYDDEDSQMNASFETQKSYTSDLDYQYNPQEFEESKYDVAKDYTKENGYTQTNEEYNKEAEKYALGRKPATYDKVEYQKSIEYEKIPEVYPNFDEKEYETRQNFVYEYTDSVDMLRNQQQNLQLLQDQHRVNENQNFFNENHIKQEIEFSNDEEKFLYERNKEQTVVDDDCTVSAPNTPSTIYESPRIMEQIAQQVKQEPDANNGCETVVQPQESPYYNSTEHNINGCYPQMTCRPGPELLIAKQNALAAHTQLWQNTMKRPFFYSETPRYNTPTIIHRYEDLSRILQ